jgi:hypothetical protein
MIEAGTSFEDQMKLQAQSKPPGVGGADNKPPPKRLTLLGIDMPKETES